MCTRRPVGMTMNKDESDGRIDVEETKKRKNGGIREKKDERNRRHRRNRWVEIRWPKKSRKRN